MFYAPYTTSWALDAQLIRCLAKYRLNEKYALLTNLAVLKEKVSMPLIPNVYVFYAWKHVLQRNLLWTAKNEIAQCHACNCNEGKVKTCEVGTGSHTYMETKRKFISNLVLYWTLNLTAQFIVS